MKKTKYIIAVNGRPAAGKDTLGRLFLDNIEKSTIMKMASPIADSLKACFSLSDTEYTHYREEGKEQPLLGDNKNPSFRTCMIDFGEKFLKRSFYPEIFSSLLWKRLLKIIDNECFIITDIGFQGEFDLLCEHVRSFNSRDENYNIEILLYRIERQSVIPELSLFEKMIRTILRKKNFPGDSREFVDVSKNVDVVKRFVVYNNDSSVEYLESFVKGEIKECILTQE